MTVSDQSGNDISQVFVGYDNGCLTVTTIGEVRRGETVGSNSTGQQERHSSVGGGMRGKNLIGIRMVVWHSQVANLSHTLGPSSGSSVCSLETSWSLSEPIGRWPCSTL